MAGEHSPIPGSTIFRSLWDRKCIVMAVNARMTPGVVSGIMRAAKDMDAAMIFEIARTEGNLEGGYTGMTPKEYSARVNDAAEDVGVDVWALHADHIGIKNGDDAEIESTKALIRGQIDAGFTSFAIDASHLFDFQGGSLDEELRPNIEATAKIGHFISETMGDKPFGLEVEVGEIGRKGEHGMVLTSPEEAVTFIRALNKVSVDPQIIAIANGSTHGNVYDEHGNPIEQVTIDIERTKAVSKALEDAGLRVRIAQHGITGTPLNLINTKFPKGAILKGNVATHWQNLFYDMVKIHEPSLYEDIWNWVMDTYREKAKGKRDVEIFGKFSKFGCRQFFNEMNSLDEEIVKTIEARAYADARLFIHAFASQGTASIVRKNIRG